MFFKKNWVLEFELRPQQEILVSFDDSFKIFDKDWSHPQVKKALSRKTLHDVSNVCLLQPALFCSAICTEKNPT